MKDGRQLADFIARVERNLGSVQEKFDRVRADASIIVTQDHFDWRGGRKTRPARDWIDFGHIWLARRRADPVCFDWAGGIINQHLIAT